MVFAYPTVVWGFAASFILLVPHSCTAQSRYDTNGIAKVPSGGTIGVATQDPEGTIVMQLRTPSGSGIVGDALVRYAPDDPHYAAVARHIGPIPKGGSVFVKPFPDR